MMLPRTRQCYSLYFCILLCYFSANALVISRLYSIKNSHKDTTIILFGSNDIEEIKSEKNSNVSLPDKELNNDERIISQENFATVKDPPKVAQPTPALFMKALNTSPRRIFLSTLASTAIALISNFCGVTSNILSIVPENLVEKIGLDVFYPRGDMKRFKSGEYQYTFVVPKEWVQDTAVELAKIQTRAARLDYSMKKNANGSIPDVAYGPPGYFNEKGISQSDTNVSTLVSRVKPGFTLESLGSPSQAAETLLRVSLAPEGSGKTATLLAACGEIRGESNLYQFEYKVDRGNKGLPLRAVSIITVSNSSFLVTMTVVALEKEFQDKVFEAKLRKIAQSFKLTK